MPDRSSQTAQHKGVPTAVARCIGPGVAADQQVTAFQHRRQRPHLRLTPTRLIGFATCRQCSSECPRPLPCPHRPRSDQHHGNVAEAVQRLGKRSSANQRFWGRVAPTLTAINGRAGHNFTCLRQQPIRQLLPKPRRSELTTSRRGRVRIQAAAASCPAWRRPYGQPASGEAP